MAKPDKMDRHLRCSFCGKSRDEVRKLIAGPTVYICDECVNLCNDIIAEDWEEAKDGGIFAVIDYEEPLAGDSGAAVLSEYLDGTGYLDNDEAIADVATRIAERFILIDRQKSSVTLSGL